MRRLLRQRPSPAMIVALIALFVALGGSSYAVTKISTKNLRTGAVNSRVVKNNSLRSADIRNESLTGGDIKTDSLKNADIDNSSLRASSADTATRANTAGSADTAANAGTAANADKLGGIAASGYTRPGCDSLSGAVKGFARIAASAGFSGTFTTTGVENSYNCSGGTVEARSLGTGTYEVRFNGATPLLAFADVLEDALPTITSVSIGRVAPGTFRVQTVDTASGTNADNVKFVIAAL